MVLSKVRLLITITGCLALVVIAFGLFHYQYQEAEPAKAAFYYWNADVDDPIPVGVQGSAAVSLGGLVYVFGGIDENSDHVDTVQIYDPAEVAGNRWSTDVTDPIPAVRSHGCAVAVGAQIYYILGRHSGNSVDDDVFIYDPAQSDGNRWTTGATAGAINGRHSFACAVEGTEIFVLGGLDGTNMAHDDVFSYDTVGDSWTTAGYSTKPTAAGRITGQNINSIIYTAGGGETVVEAYDIGLDSWSVVASLPPAPTESCSIAYDGYFYLISGLGDSYVRRYDPGDDRWVQWHTLNNSRKRCSAVEINDTFYVFSGVDAVAGITTDFETLDAFEGEPPAQMDAELLIPSDGAIVSIKPYLAARYVHGIFPGFTEYRVSSSSLVDCVNDTNTVALVTSETTETNEEPTGVFITAGIAENTTYYWCARNQNSEITGDWISMGEFTTDAETPRPLYSTYLGGTLNDEVYSIDVGSSGIIYVSGATDFSDFPTTAGAFDQLYDDTNPGNFDAVVSAIDPQGNGINDLIFSTYLGGAGSELGGAIAVDGSFVYVAGTTDSDDFPIDGGVGGTPFDGTNIAGESVAFVSVLSLDGSTLEYSTYFGTSGTLNVNAMVVDAGDVYVGGDVFGSVLPTTGGAFDTTLDTSQDGFMMSLSPDGNGASDLLYSTYFGGNNNQESVQALAIDTGHIYFGMYTHSTNLSTTLNAYDTSANGNRDMYIGRLNPAGGGSADLIYGTYLGGTSFDGMGRIAVDSGLIYVTGLGITSVNFPTTIGAYTETYPGTGDGTFSIIDPASGGAADLIYSTFLNGLFGGREVFVKTDGSVYIFGQSTPTLPLVTTANAFDDTLDSQQFGLGIVHLDPVGGGASDLLYATVIESFNSQNYTQPGDMAYLPSQDSVYIAGGVGEEFPTLAYGGDPYDRFFNGSTDAYIMQFTFAPASPNPPVSPTLRFPDEASVRAGKVFLSAFYEHDLLVGTTEYRVSSSSAGDCLSGVNIVDSGSSTVTTSILEPTLFEVVDLVDGTYYWCARNDDGSLQSAWTTMGSFIQDSSVPYVNYISYLGGTDTDSITEVDLVGSNMYFVGNTGSIDLPTTAGVIDETSNGGGDVFVGSFAPGGNGVNDLVFLTYIGSTGAESSYGIQHEGTSLYIAGFTDSATFPTTAGAYDVTHNGGNDGFAMRLNDDGSSIEYSTYIGGTGGDIIVLGEVEGGVLYLGGSAGNGTFPTTAGAYDTTFTGGSSDGVIVILNPAGGGATDLVYSTYIGGTSFEGVDAVAHVGGLIYFGADPFSSNFPTTGGAYDTTNNGAADLVFGRLNPAGGGSSDLQYSSFVGGSSNEFLNAFAFDQTTGEIYASGVATTGFPTTAGAYDTSFSGDGDIFIVKFDTSVAGAGALEYSTFMGGVGVEFTDDLVFDGTDVFVVGASLSENSVVTPATAYGNSYVDGGFSDEDAYLVRLTPSGGGIADLQYASYFGADDTSERFTGVQVDGEIAYLVGVMQPFSFEAFADPGTAYDSTPSNFDQDGFIMRIDFAGAPANSAPTAPTTLFTGNSDAQGGSVNPTGITSSTPVFSAICTDPNAGDIMDLYRIQVDDNNDFSSVLWDSGALGTSMAICVAGARSANITYGGAPLTQDGTTYYWRIKFWDDEPSEGAFSESPTSTNTFTMATAGGGGGGGTSIQRLQTLQSLAVPTIGPVTALDSQSVRYEWTYSGANHTGFRIINDLNQVAVQVPSSSAIAATEEGLPHNTRISGRKVTAYNSSGESQPSAVYGDVYTHMVLVTPELVSRIGDEIRVRIGEELNNLQTALSGVQFELIPLDQVAGVQVTTGPWLQQGSYTFTGTVPEVAYLLRARARNQIAVETAWSSSVTIPAEEIEPGVAQLSVSLTLTPSDGQSLSNPLNPNSIIYGEITVNNNGTANAENVLVTLPVPDYISYIPGTLSVDGVKQTDGADGDFAQNGNEMLSSIWPQLDFGFGHTIRFQLGFDTQRLIEEYVLPVLEEQGINRSDILREITNVQTETSPLRQTIQREVNTVLAQALAAVNPEITMQAQASHEADPEPVYSNQEGVQPDLLVLEQAIVAELEPDATEPELEPVPTPEQVEIIDQILQQEFPQPGQQTSQTPILQGGTTSNSDGGSFSIQTSSGDNQLSLTGSARPDDDQIQFTGTTSEPFSVVTLIFNGSVTAIAVSDANGNWQTFVSAEQLGISEGQSAQVRIEAIAAKGDLRSERVEVADVLVSRGMRGDVVAEFETQTGQQGIVRAVQETVEQTIEAVQENEPEIRTALVVSAPVVVVSSVPLWGYLPYAPTLIYHLLTYFIGLIGRKRKGGAVRFYGVAYDSITKQPLALAIIRVYKVEPVLEAAASVGAAAATAKKLVTTIVTDKAGRYDALLQPGSYTLEVSKPAYLFPSQIVTTQADGDFAHVYDQNNGIKVEGDQLTIPDVPMDPVNAQRQWQLASGSKKIWLAIQRIGDYLAVPVLFIGALVSALVVVATPDRWINWAIAIIYILLLAMQIKLRAKHEKSWGVVYDIATNAVLPLTTVQLIEPASSKVVTSRLSDYHGRFAFLPEPGKYVIKASKPGYQQVAEVVEAPQTDRQPLHGEISIEKPDQRITGDVAMRQL